MKRWRVAALTCFNWIAMKTDSQKCIINIKSVVNFGGIEVASFFLGVLSLYTETRAYIHMSFFSPISSPAVPKVERQLNLARRAARRHFISSWNTLNFSILFSLFCVRSIAGRLFTSLKKCKNVKMLLIFRLTRSMAFYLPRRALRLCSLGRGKQNCFGVLRFCLDSYQPRTITVTMKMLSEGVVCILPFRHFHINNFVLAERFLFFSFCFLLLESILFKILANWLKKLRVAPSEKRKTSTLSVFNSY